MCVFVCLCVCVCVCVCECCLPDNALFLLPRLSLQDGLANTGAVIASLFCACQFMTVADDAINVFARKRTVGLRNLLTESQRRQVVLVCCVRSCFRLSLCLSVSVSVRLFYR